MIMSQSRRFDSIDDIEQQLMEDEQQLSDLQWEIEVGELRLKSAYDLRELCKGKIEILKDELWFHLNTHEEGEIDTLLFGTTEDIEDDLDIVLEPTTYYEPNGRGCENECDTLSPTMGSLKSSRVADHVKDVDAKPTNEFESYEWFMESDVVATKLRKFGPAINEEAVQRLIDLCKTADYKTPSSSWHGGNTHVEKDEDSIEVPWWKMGCKDQLRTYEFDELMMILMYNEVSKDIGETTILCKMKIKSSTEIPQCMVLEQVMNEFSTTTIELITNPESGISGRQSYPAINSPSTTANPSKIKPSALIVFTVELLIFEEEENNDELDVDNRQHQETKDDELTKDHADEYTVSKEESGAVQEFRLSLQRPTTRSTTRTIDSPTLRSDDSTEPRRAPNAPTHQPTDKFNLTRRRTRRDVHPGCETARYVVQWEDKI